MLKRIIAVILVIAAFMTLLTGCKKEEKEEVATKKDLQVVYNDYVNTVSKRSDFNLNMIITFYVGDEAVNLGQGVSGLRIANNGVYYGNADLFSQNTGDNLINSVNSILRLINSGNSLRNDWVEYLSGKTKFYGEMGCKDGVYNGRGDYLSREEGAVPDYSDGVSSLWGVTTDGYISKFLSDSGYRGSFTLSDYIMLNSVVNLQDESWIKSDTAELTLDKNDQFNYRATAYSDKMKDYVISQIKSYADDMDEEKYPAEIEFYNKYVEEIASWFSVAEPNVEAKTNSSDKLIYLKTNLVIDINITTARLVEILRDFIKIQNKHHSKDYNPEKPLSDEEEGFISLAGTVLGLAFNDKNAQTGKMTFTFTFNTEERFSYDEAALDLTAYGDVMFTPLTEEQKNAKDGNYYDENKRYIWKGGFKEAKA